MRSMKKWMGIVVAGIMCLAMGITAVAADSPASPGIVRGAVRAIDGNGNEVTVSFEGLDEAGESVVAELKDTEVLKDILGDDFADGMELLDAQKVTVEGVTAWPVTITFDVPGILPTTKVSILYFDGSEWKVVPCKAGEGTIEAIFDSLPEGAIVAFIVDKNTMAAGTTGSATSPETGESKAVMGFALVALLAAGGAWALNTKKRA